MINESGFGLQKTCESKFGQDETGIGILSANNRVV